MNATSSGQLVGRVTESNLAAVPARGELEPRESVDRHRVGLDTAHVTECEARTARREQVADALAEPRQIGARDRAADGKGDRAWRRGAHRGLDRSVQGNSSVRGIFRRRTRLPPPMSSARSIV